MGYGRLIGKGKVAEVFEYGDGRVLKLYRAGQPKREPEREAAVLDWYNPLEFRSRKAAVRWSAR